MRSSTIPIITSFTDLNNLDFTYKKRPGSAGLRSFYFSLKNYQPVENRQGEMTSENQPQRALLLLLSCLRRCIVSVPDI